MHHKVMASTLGLCLMLITGCESMTGKTTGQTIDDASITASVQKKLTSDKLSNFVRINVDTDQSVVTLKGTVRSVEEKSRAEDLARQVNGVTKVNNNLSIQSITMGTP